MGPHLLVKALESGHSCMWGSACLVVLSNSVFGHAVTDTDFGRSPGRLPTIVFFLRAD